jgi:hypothetical protein
MPAQVSAVDTGSISLFSASAVGFDPAEFSPRNESIAMEAV